MSAWVLVLILKTDAVSITHVGGYTSKASCEAAGVLWDSEPGKSWLGWATHKCLPVDATRTDPSGS